MSDKLLKIPQDSALVKKLNPVVTSTANPPGEWLNLARAELNLAPDLKAIFSEASSPDEAVYTMAVRLAALWGEDGYRAFECVQYLWDEYQQLGEDKIHLVSPETGRVLATLDESDLWQPDPVPRESGEMAIPLRRIRPDLEGAITLWISDEQREKKIVAALAKRSQTTGLLHEEGDPRLRIATGRGRRHIAAEALQYDPEALLRAAGGTAGQFLQHFDLVREAPTNSSLTELKGLFSSRRSFGAQDLTTSNLQYNHGASIRGVVVQGWVREIARLLSTQAHKHVQGKEVSVDDLRSSDLQSDIWVSDPSTMKAMQKVDPSIRVLPVEGVSPVGLTGKVGVIVVPAAIESVSQERFDRWIVQAAGTYSVWVDWSAVSSLTIQDVAHEAVVL